MRINKYLYIIVFTCLFLTNASASEVASYQADYDISLASVSRGSGIINAYGTMTYTQINKCNEWHFNSQIRLKIIKKGGEEESINWNVSGIEGDDGNDFSFSVNNVKEAGSRVAFAGVANRDAKNAEFTLPKKLSIELPDNTMFPISQMKQILKAIDNKEMFLSINYFDGSSFSSLYKNSIIIVKPKLDEDKKIYPINMAFTTYGTKGELPDYELYSEIDAQGVSHYIRQDFGDFSVNIKANSITYKDSILCN